MKSSRACALLLSIFALAALTFAGESWRKKPFTDWSEKEVREILEKSPWAHRVKVMVVKPGPEKPPCTSATRRCNSDGDPATPSGYPGRRRPGSIDDVQAEQQKPSNAPGAPILPGVAAVAVVRWASARTVREAVARSDVQRGTAKPEQVYQPSRFTPVGAYVVYVDLRVVLADVQRVPKSGVFTTEMAQNSVLIIKSTGQRLSALSVQKAPLPEFDERKELALAAFYIIFPLTIDGKPSLPGDDVTVRFECPTVPVPIASEFVLPKMSRDGSPDL